MVGVVGSSPIAPTNFFFSFKPSFFEKLMFTLSLQGEESTQAMLQSGHSYCLVVRSETQRAATLKALGAQDGVVIVPHNGGLISNLRVWENIILPVQYHGIQLAGELEEHVTTLLDQCGLSDDTLVTALMLKLPDQLTVYEKRLVAFVRSMLMGPQLIVYDGLNEGLFRKELLLVGKFEQVFRMHFPARTSALVSYEEDRAKSDPHQLVIHL